MIKRYKEYTHSTVYLIYVVLELWSDNNCHCKIVLNMGGQL